MGHVFGGIIPLWPMNERDDELTEQMQSYWAQFAKTGNPNSDEAPMWPAFGNPNPREIAFGHDKTYSRPVARAALYEAMYEQFAEREMRFSELHAQVAAKAATPDP